MLAGFIEVCGLFSWKYLERKITATGLLFSKFSRGNGNSCWQLCHKLSGTQCQVSWQLKYQVTMVKSQLYSWCTMEWNGRMCSKIHTQLEDGHHLTRQRPWTSVLHLRGHWFGFSCYSNPLVPADHLDRNCKLCCCNSCIINEMLPNLGGVPASTVWVDGGWKVLGEQQMHSSDYISSNN